MRKPIVKKAIYILSALVLSAAGVYASFCLHTRYGEFKQRQAELESRKNEWANLGLGIRKESDEFRGLASIIIKDLDTGWQININDDRLLPSASLVKVPIMFSCFLAVNEGRLSLDEALTLKGSDMALGSGILKSFPAGSKFRVEKLIEIMISESDNTAANMLISRLGFNYINACFKKANLNSTNISRKMMDFKSRRKGIENFTTAKDITFILDKIYRSELINKDYSQKCFEFLQKQKVNDRIPARLPAGTLVAHKTGLEKGICHDAGIVFAPEGKLLICVLTKHGSKSAAPAKKFIADISLMAYNYVNNKGSLSKINSSSTNGRSNS